MLATAGLSINAMAASHEALIAEVYGGGGNSGATYTNDFVELGNAGSGSVDLSGYSVQYLPGAPTASSKWQSTPLTGSLAGGGRYLVQEAAGTGGTKALPTPDATGSINMSGTNGTVALVTGSDPLTCLTAADCQADPRVKDLVGFGTAVVHEGNGAAAGAGNTASVARSASLADTDDNAADFTAGDPSPQNTGDTGGGPTPTDPPTTPPPSTPPATPAKIHDIQGDSRISPLDGKAVSGVTGIVTGVRAYGSSQGFWFQDPNPDADPRTSEGVFVFTGSTTPAVKVGDSVSVDATVQEYYPGGQSTGVQSVTELTKATVTVASSGNTLPAPIVLDKHSVPERFAPQAGGASIENLPLRPDEYALDTYESLEGMNVRIGSSRVVGAT
ncbi:lamin tail domain-containing protein, partial [Streptomyces sp. NPDC007162]|uniref:lamin tail domain-containing protein n=1 Tax=Streptomyces sp. NPDC007162 TaxID=3156917 RepID=UPI0033C913DC